MGSYHVPNDFACCLLLKKLKIKARTKWCKAHYRWQWTPGGITLNRAWFPLCSQALLWDMRTALMSAHTLDLEYAQSNFCTGGKRQLNKREGGKKTFSSWFEWEEFVYKCCIYIYRYRIITAITIPTGSIDNANIEGWTLDTKLQQEIILDCSTSPKLWLSHKPES